ncbi:unnamed protein product, partial [Ectocarpus fasciculatus]
MPPAATHEVGCISHRTVLALSRDHCSEVAAESKETKNAKKTTTSLSCAPRFGMRRRPTPTTPTTSTCTYTLPPEPTCISSRNNTLHGGARTPKRRAMLFTTHQRLFIQ